MLTNKPPDTSPISAGEIDTLEARLEGLKKRALALELEVLKAHEAAWDLFKREFPERAAQIEAKTEEARGIHRHLGRLRGFLVEKE